MAIEIFKDLRPLTIEKTIAEALPLDTSLTCPACEGHNIEAKRAKTSLRYGKPGDMEDPETVPRLQDRFCVDCRHRWTSVLPPSDFNERQSQYDDHRRHNV